MPHIYIIAGPNGAGKSTTARTLLPSFLGCLEFVNADDIARGLSAFRPENVGFLAGRIMLKRLDELILQQTDFAFETTLASRTFAPWLRQQQASGFNVHLVFLWLHSADMAVARVAARVQAGGHRVDEVDIRRRYQRGLDNLAELYIPLANSQSDPQLVAYGGSDEDPTILVSETWQRLIYRHER